jgi:triacylglycerol lipase
MNIVLMHGILGFGAVIPPFPQYFNQVKPFLEQRLQAHVCVTAVPPIGKIQARAAAAAEQVAAALAAATLDPALPIHVIAHSMGGLDARCVIAQDLQGLRRRVRTLACIGTPHLGSPVADLVNNLDLADPLFALISPHSPVVSQLRQHVDGVQDLTTTSAAVFNHENPDISAVAYLNVAGTGRTTGLHTSAFFQPTFLYLVLRGDGQNDGVVSFTSASRGQQPAGTWPCDHADLIGHDLDQPLLDSTRTDHLVRYEALVRQFPA